VQKIVKKVEKRLVDAEKDDVFLKIDDYRLDDDWLYIVVLPARPGVRAADHARLMARIERELRQQGDDNVLLVPALEE